MKRMGILSTLLWLLAAPLHAERPVAAVLD